MKRFGFKPLTDAIKAKIFGLNSAESLWHRRKGEDERDPVGLHDETEGKISCRRR